MGGIVFFKVVALSLTLLPNDPTGFFGYPALAVLTPLGSVAVPVFYAFCVPKFYSGALASAFLEPDRLSDD